MGLNKDVLINLFGTVIVVVLVSIIVILARGTKCDCSGSSHAVDVLQKRIEIDKNYVLLDSMREVHDSMLYENQKRYLLDYLQL